MPHLESQRTALPYRRDARAAERGMIMWTALFLILVMSGLSVGMLWNGLGEKASVEHRKTSLTALHICEVGTLRAQMEILAQKDSGTDGIGIVSGSYAGGTYYVTSVQTPGHEDRWTVTAEGVYRNSKKRIETGLRRRRNGDWIEGLFAKEALTFNGDSSTDAYDSRLGTYASQAVNNDAGGSFAEGGGHVGSNLDINLNGTAINIRGDAIPGMSHDVLTSGSPTVWGDMMPRRREVPLPPATLAEFVAAAATNDNATILESTSGPGGGGKSALNPRTGALQATGTKKVTLPGGTYYFSDVSFSGGATLEITGPSVIYVTGSFDVSGGALINASMRPGDLLIYAHPYTVGGVAPPTTRNVEFGGGSTTALAVYAPGVDVKIHGSGDVLGSVVGKNITALGDASFHYDKALGAWDRHAVTIIERLYWKDLSAPLR